MSQERIQTTFVSDRLALEIANLPGAVRPSPPEPLREPELDRAARIEVTSSFLLELLERPNPDPRTVESFVDSLESSGRGIEGEALLRALVRARPDIEGLHTRLGRLLETMKREDEALAEYSAALVVNPYHLDAYVYRGNLLLKRGKLARANQDFLVAIGLDPNGSNPNTLQAWALRAETNREQRRLHARRAAIRYNRSRRNL